MAPRARLPRLAAALLLAAAARAMSATKKRKQIQKLKELRASEWAHLAGRREIWRPCPPPGKHPGAS